MERLLICVNVGVAKKIACSLPPAGEPNRGIMASTEVNPNVNLNPANEPELHLLLAPDTFEPLWKSLFRGLDEFFFPKKLPPLKLESKPIPVKDIWGFYNYKKNGALGSTVAHVIVIALIIGGTILGRRMVTKVEAKPTVTVTLIDPGDLHAEARKDAGGRRRWRRRPRCAAGLARDVCRSSRCSRSRRQQR